MQAALAELPNVEAVTHAAGTDRFIVRHSGQLDDAACAVDRRVIFRDVRRWLERIAPSWSRRLRK